jgi:hypothetical protein
MSNISLSGPAPELRFQIGTPIAASAAGAVLGTGVDHLGANFVVLEAETGAVTGAPTTQTLDAKVQHSDTQGGTYTDFQPGGGAAAGAISQITTVSTRKRKTIDLRGAKRWVRVSTTTGFTGGTSPTLLNSVKIVFASFDTLPAQVDD